MYKAANISYGSDITFEDFKKIFASDEYAGTLQKATLNLDGKYMYSLVVRMVKQGINIIHLKIVEIQQFIVYW